MNSPEGFRHVERHIMAYADTDPDTAEHIVGMFRRSLDYLGIELAGILGVSASDPGDAAANAEARQEAFSLGHALSSRPS